MTIPDKTAAASFRARWLKTFGLPPRGWRAQLRRDAQLRPFAEASVLAELVVYLIGGLPATLAAAAPERARVAEAYGWLCFQAWQSGSHFPAFAENYAQFLREGLASDGIDASHCAVGDLLLDGLKASGSCGFQRLILSDPVLVRESEQSLLSGDFAAFLKAGVKYNEFEEKLGVPDGFSQDWRKLSAAFPMETSSKQILHRSLLPERHWVRDGGASFRTRAGRFQAALDLLCWKYCLWGVAGGQPLLLKPSVVFTPHGTQIFIPAYLSFDARRDLDFSLINKLHRARGVQRQGEGFSGARAATKLLRERAKAADRDARMLGLRGDKRYDYVAKQIGRIDSGDYRATRKLLGRTTETDAS
jgi:hypothetical protein